MLLLAVVLAACEDDDDGGDERGGEPTPAATTPATPAGTLAPDAIRSVDLAGDEHVLRMVQGTGGEFSRDDVLYEDLTRDGREEAIIPIPSGGTMGNLGMVVLTLDGGAAAPRQLLALTGSGIGISVEEGKLVLIEPVPAPDDPECCPSQLSRTVYAWNGSALSVESTEILTPPGGGIPAASTP